MDDKLLNVSWEESKKFIISHSRQENKHFGAQKLQMHLENYYTKKPVDDELGIKHPMYRVDTYRQYKPVRYSHELSYIDILKSRILRFDYKTGDKKQLVSDYIEYMAIRPKSSKLLIGRVQGEKTPLRQAKIIAAIHGDKCVICGSTEYLEVHHIESLSKTGNRDIDNQVPVCKLCHRIVDGRVKVCDVKIVRAEVC